MNCRRKSAGQREVLKAELHIGVGSHKKGGNWQY